jgi:hypothetical protein
MRKLLVVLTLLGAGTAFAAECITSIAQLPTDKVFGQTSFWYTPIPNAAPLHANNANLVKEFNRQRTTWYQTVNINTREYTSPVYTVGPEVPTVAVGWNDCQKKGFVERGMLAQLSAVPIPANAREAAGTDDLSAGHEYRLGNVAS